jgi:LuxR family transcriptional regulator, maltose regulon positive regulatory protein
VLLRTKLHVPARHELVPRPQLLDLLGAGSGRRLTLITAPAGWGKTSALSQWAAGDDRGRRFTWVSLDPADNDRVRFWTYVVEALRTVDPAIGEAALALLRTRGTREVDAFLPRLVNDLTSTTQEIVLVLDDYHVIANAEIHHGVAFLIDHMPPTVQLAIATRIDPPLPLPRLKARREVLEIREGALRFSDEEATALLNDVLGLRLSLDDVALLQRRTEGWAAGLCLAALSLQGRTDAQRFIAAFAGDDHHIVDYLSAEVLQRAPATLRGFLLGTSVLARMCAPLCDAVLDRDDSMAMLRELERANLFVVPLDPRREWYRYHHLFGELLRHELRTTTPALEPTLHLRAAAWLRSQGLIPEAIQHAVQGADVVTATELIAAHWLDYFNLGRLTTVEGWLDALPDRTVTDDARLGVARAWLALDSGQLDEVRRWTELASRAAEHGTQGDELRPSVEILRTVRLFKEGDLIRARSSAMTAIDLLGTKASFPLTVATIILGVTDQWLGRPRGAQPALERAAELGRETDNHLGTAYALGYLGLLHTDEGSPDEAEATLDEVDRLIEAERAVGEHFVAMIARLARGRLREREGKIEEADAALERAVELGRRGAGRLEIAAALLSLAERRHAEHDRTTARRLLGEARELIDACEEPGEIARWLSRTERTLRQAPVDGDTWRPLTERELVVLRLLPTDLSQRQIAESLFVSRNTVKSQLKSLYRKLDASSREEAVERARQLGLL